MLHGFDILTIQSFVEKIANKKVLSIEPFQYCKKNLNTGSIIAFEANTYYFARISGSGDQNPTLNGISQGFSSGLILVFDSFSITGINLPVQIVGVKLKTA